MAAFSKGKNVYMKNLKPGELIHMYFALHNVSSVLGFTSVITVLCANTIILWVYPTASKRGPVEIIRFISTTFNI